MDHRGQTSNMPWRFEMPDVKMLKSRGKADRRMTMQLWTTGVASARGSAHTAQEIEAAGWDGMLVVDSQNLSGDPYVSLALAGAATTRIGLGTGVTNSVTRHAAATATAITSVNRVSDGRAVLGIGRGDSALAHLGRAPAKLGQFERYLRHLQVALELPQLGRRTAEMGKCRVTAADAEHGAAVRHAIDAGDRRGRRRGVAGHRVG